MAGRRSLFAATLFRLLRLLRHGDRSGADAEHPLSGPFRSPYKARNIIEYWQRWHISLTQYLMQYLYNPLALWLTRRRIARGAAVDRRGRASFRGFTELVAVPTTVTIVLAGVWHGSGLTFFVFGVMHPAYLVVNHAWRALGKAARAAGRSGAVWRVALTYGASWRDQWCSARPHCKRRAEFSPACWGCTAWRPTGRSCGSR